MSTPARPRPQPSAQSQPFWDFCAAGELRLQRCQGCGAWRFPPAERCPECLSAIFQWLPSSGRGTLYTFVVFRRAYHPAFVAGIPYVVGLIELEEGPRMISNIVGCPPEQVRCEMPVEVVFDRSTDGLVLPKFRPRAKPG